jgi:hypothetical protein
LRRRLFGFASLGLLLVAFAGAAFYVQAEPAGRFEDEVVQADIAESGPQAMAALAQYPAATVRVFGLYGQAPELAEVLRRYGHNQIIPIVDKCLQGGDSFLEMGGAFDQIVGSLTRFQWPKVQQLTADECGWRAILLTLSAGNDFLGQFTADASGEARRLPGSSVLATAKGLATGGLQSLERKLVLGQETTWRDWGAAGLDVAAVGVAAKSVSVVARARLATSAVRPAFSATMMVAADGIGAFAKSAAPRIAKYATLGGLAYLAVYHPGVISSGVRTIAEIVGVDPVLAQVIVWCAIFFLPVWLAINALIAVRSVVGAVRRLGAFLAQLARALARPPKGLVALPPFDQPAIAGR